MLGITRAAFVRLCFTSCFLLSVCARTFALAPQGGESINGFPNWSERVLHEWTNRARCDPQVEMNQCGSACSEGACYSAKAPLPWVLELNRSARFHSDEMVAQNFFAHDSHCTLPANISSLYPSSCTGAASCACQGGISTCAPVCTTWNSRIALFGGNASGEVIASVSSSDPVTAFYLWLYEPYTPTTCGFGTGNGHRWLLLSASGGLGAGVSGQKSTIDFGAASPSVPKIPSGSHYPRQASSVAVWANWYDSAAPTEALVNVDGTTHPLTLQRGTPQNGAWSASISGVGSGCHRYYFIFQDSSGATFTYPGTGSLGIGPAGCADWDASRPLTAYSLCFGDGTAGSCPCLNSGAAGHGCANSQVAAGALLGASGGTLPDTVVLSSSGELTTALSIFLQGNARIASVTFGDGLRCAGGNLKRIGLKNAVAGTASYPEAGDPSITLRSAALGDSIAPGSSRYYQAYYRDASLVFCPAPPGNTWNATQALQIVW